jgi:pyrrolidone-carboxylate peptidase
MLQFQAIHLRCLTIYINLIITDDAGNFLCNYTYFITQYYIKSKSKKDAQTRIPSLFVHIPCDEVTYSLQELRRAVQVIIENVLKQVCELEANEHNK